MQGGCFKGSPLGDHTTRKDDNGDQPSGGETTMDKYWSDTYMQRIAQDRLETAC